MGRMNEEKEKDTHVAWAGIIGRDSGLSKVRKCSIIEVSVIKRLGLSCLL